jgi:hypothetical protein
MKNKKLIKLPMKKIIFIIIATLISSIGIVKAAEVYVSLTVPAWYNCAIVKFDLVCQTNAQKILINGAEYQLIK